MGAGNGTRTETGTGTRVGMVAGTGTKIERREKGRESPETYEVIVELGCHTLGKGRRERVTSSHSRKPDAPARQSHHAVGHSSETGGEGQARGGWRRGVEAQDDQGFKNSCRESMSLCRV